MSLKRPAADGESCEQDSISFGHLQLLVFQQVLVSHTGLARSPDEPEEACGDGDAVAMPRTLIRIQGLAALTPISRIQNRKDEQQKYLLLSARTFFVCIDGSGDRPGHRSGDTSHFDGFHMVFLRNSTNRNCSVYESLIRVFIT